MHRHQFQRQIAVKSILVVTAVFLVMTAVFSGYIVHTGGKAFEELFPMVVSIMPSRYRTYRGESL